MLSVLANRTYRHPFLAQVIALVGTGLATVATGRLARPRHSPIPCGKRPFTIGWPP
jgi:hypothetical protein